MNNICQISSCPQPKTRRSQRRKFRKPQNPQQYYQIPNPYRSSHSHSDLPSSLTNQLSKFDFLSMKNLQSISFISPQSHSRRHNKLTNKIKCIKSKIIDSDSEIKLLRKMQSAANKQEEQYEKWVNFMSSYQQQNNQSKSQNQQGRDHSESRSYSESRSENQSQCQINIEDNQQLQLCSIGNMFNQDSGQERYLFYPDQNALDHGIMHQFKLQVQNYLI